MKLQIFRLFSFLIIFSFFLHRIPGKPQNSNIDYGSGLLQSDEYDSGETLIKNDKSKKLVLTASNSSDSTAIANNSMESNQITTVTEPTKFNNSNNTKTFQQSPKKSKESFDEMWQKFLDSPDDQKFQALANLLMANIIWFVVVFISSMLACCACIWLTVCCCCFRNNH